MACAWATARLPAEAYPAVFRSILWWCFCGAARERNWCLRRRISVAITAR